MTGPCSPCGADGASSFGVGPFVVGSGDVVAPEGMTLGGNGTVLPANNTNILVPFVLKYGFTVASVLFDITTPVAGSLCDVALYSSGATGFPDALLATSLGNDCAAGGLVTCVFAGGQVVAAGQLWLGYRFRVGVTAPTVRNCALQQFAKNPAALTLASFAYGYQMAGAAFPNPWASTTLYSPATNTHPIMCLKVA